MRKRSADRLIIRNAAAAILLIVFVIAPVYVFAESSNDTDIAYGDETSETETGEGLDKIMEAQSKSSGMDVIEKQLDKFGTEDLQEIIGDFEVSNIIEDLTAGKLDLSPNRIISGILNSLLKEIFSNINIILKFLAVAIICAIIKNLRAGFMNEGVGELAFYVSYIVMVSIMVVSFSQVLKAGSEIIGNMVDFMYATAPVLMTLMVTNGNIISGGVMQPILLLVVETAATVFSRAFIPLTSMAAAVSIVNNISQQIKLSKLAELVKKVCTWGIGLFLTVFGAFIAVQGSLGAVVDGVASKSLKFTISTIPVVGKYIADAAETVLGCTLLLKNAGGVAVMLGIVGIALFPLLKMGAVIVMYKIAGAIIEPISDKRITDCVDDVSKAMSTIFGIVTAVVIMFLITVTAIVGASNLSTMVR